MISQYVHKRSKRMYDLIRSLNYYADDSGHASVVYEMYETGTARPIIISDENLRDNFIPSRSCTTCIHYDRVKNICNQLVFLLQGLPQLNSIPLTITDYSAH